LASIDSWVCYYGGGQIEELAKFDLVDLDADPGLPGAYSIDDIRSLRERGVIVVSYLNLGTIEDFRIYEPQLRRYRLGENAHWPGEHWLDVSQPPVQGFLVEKVAAGLVAQGVDGFFLDNLDVLLEYRSEAMRQGMVALVVRLRETYPDHLLIGQNALYLMDEELPDGRSFWQLLDALSVEETYSRYVDGEYEPVRRRTVRDSEDELTDLLERGLPILTLDYTVDEDEIAEIAERSRDHGFVPYISTVDLQSIHTLP
jgi:cysteinyl-tRNA synthetase